MGALNVSAGERTRRAFKEREREGKEKRKGKKERGEERGEEREGKKERERKKERGRERGREKERKRGREKERGEERKRGKGEERKRGGLNPAPSSPIANVVYIYTKQHMAHELAREFGAKYDAEADKSWYLPPSMEVDIQQRMIAHFGQKYQVATTGRPAPV